MYVRVARFEGGSADEIRQTAAMIRERSQSGPPEGVPPNSGFRLLVDPDNGRALAIGFFETEDDLRQADAALNAMDPPGNANLGNRVSVEFYEVGVEAGTV